jgi:myo-inositol 2-dehydrogenase/D-chiro-inositol 1-dehydrogenase
LQEWVEAVAAGESSGPSAWDGYAAAAVVESCLEALQRGQRSTVQLEAPPELYRGAERLTPSVGQPRVTGGTL